MEPRLESFYPPFVAGSDLPHKVKWILIVFTAISMYTIILEQTLGDAFRNNKNIIDQGLSQYKDDILPVKGFSI